MESTCSLAQINDFIYMWIVAHAHETARHMDGPGKLALLVVDAYVIVLWCVGTYFAMLVLVHFPRVVRLLLGVSVLACAALLALQAYAAAALVLLMIVGGYMSHVVATDTTRDLVNSLFPNKIGARPISKHQKVLDGG